MEIKPSYKSLEGQSLFGMVCTCLYLLYLITTGDADTSGHIETILQSAESAKEIATAYANEGSGITDIADVGKSGVIFWFMYKLYSKFVDSRTDLKKGLGDSNGK